MTTYSYTYNQKRAVICVAVLLILFVFFPVTFRILFAADYEVSYGAGLGFSTCSDFYISDESELSRCTSRYNITVGNTGTEIQELIEIKLLPVPADSYLNWNVLDIIATNKSSVRPAITEQREVEELQIQIRNLGPNRLIEFSLTGRGLEAAQAMENITVEVDAMGSMIQSNPRLTLALRFIRNLAGIFGF